MPALRANYDTSLSRRRLRWPTRRDRVLDKITERDTPLALAA